MSVLDILMLMSHESWAQFSPHPFSSPENHLLQVHHLTVNSRILHAHEIAITAWKERLIRHTQRRAVHRDPHELLPAYSILSTHVLGKKGPRCRSNAHVAPHKCYMYTKIPSQPRKKRVFFTHKAWQRTGTLMNCCQATV